ncbi:hypothetical protein HanXRQr2_Chr09g0364131 [Helianthus annuus]|uniref:Uncharacterized protein n=1 Tax=Helianthus annuus TaxID=4232 RepID=A0A9K3I2Z1_HELAN|nr:hypothetical protein HanXRQr2_Chr09g0364131 [Helianthus annuus]KAJ0891241.1 hypothetical protein HanPSC8_Chr09g0351321 [Helianthus annuus]
MCVCILITTNIYVLHHFASAQTSPSSMCAAQEKSKPTPHPFLTDFLLQFV